MDYRLKEMQAMKLAGGSYQDIADKFGISRQRVQQIMAPPSHIKQLVIEKAGGICRLCGEVVGKYGNVHHKSYSSEDYNGLDNLEYLCVSCHIKGNKQTMTDEQREKISRGILEARYKKYMATGEM